MKIDLQGNFYQLYTPSFIAELVGYNVYFQDMLVLDDRRIWSIILGLILARGWCRRTALHSWFLC